MVLDLFTLTGLLGTFVVLLAYFLNQTGRLSSDNWWFPFANLGGSLLILVSFYTAVNVPSLVIEICWIAISLYGLVRSLQRQNLADE